MKILLTAFAPFNNNDENYSELVLQEIDQSAYLIKVLLPVEYINSFTLMQEVITKHEPDIIIMLGEARSYHSVGFEVIAINEYSNRPDVKGNIPKTRYISEGGPDGIFATLDYETFTNAFSETNTKHHRSLSAGTYVCNTLLYNTLLYLQAIDRQIPCGFIHIPDFKIELLANIVAGFNNYLSKLSE